MAGLSDLQKEIFWLNGSLTIENAVSPDLLGRPHRPSADTCGTGVLAAGLRQSLFRRPITAWRQT